MTGEPGMLTEIHEYLGSDVVIIGDGSSIPITGAGTSSIEQKNIKLPLYDVLLVPELEKNLLSVSQLTSQYPVNCDFFDVNFCIKDRETGCPLITGTKKGDLYTLSNTLQAYFSHRFRNGDAELWHQ